MRKAHPSHLVARSQRLKRLCEQGWCSQNSFPHKPHYSLSSLMRAPLTFLHYAIFICHSFLTESALSAQMVSSQSPHSCEYISKKNCEYLIFGMKYLCKHEKHPQLLCKIVTLVWPEERKMMCCHWCPARLREKALNKLQKSNALVLYHCCVFVVKHVVVWCGCLWAGHSFC